MRFILALALVAAATALHTPSSTIGAVAPLACQTHARGVLGLKLQRNASPTTNMALRGGGSVDPDVFVKAVCPPKKPLGEISAADGDLDKLAASERATEDCMARLNECERRLRQSRDFFALLKARNLDPAAQSTKEENDRCFSRFAAAAVISLATSFLFALRCVLGLNPAALAADARRT